MRSRFRWLEKQTEYSRLRYAKKKIIFWDQFATYFRFNYKYSKKVTNAMMPRIYCIKTVQLERSQEASLIPFSFAPWNLQISFCSVHLFNGFSNWSLCGIIVHIFFALVYCFLRFSRICFSLSRIILLRVGSILKALFHFQPYIKVTLNKGAFFV